MWKKILNEFDNIRQSSNGIAKWFFTYINKCNWNMKQEKTSIPKNIQKYLLERYKKYPSINFTFLNKYENINYEWEISIPDDSSFNTYDRLICLLNNMWNKYRQFFKYRKYIYWWIDDNGKAVFKYYDALWNLKTKKESILILKNYVLWNDIFKKTITSYYSPVELEKIQNIKISQERKFTYKITNNVNDKLEVFKMNKKWHSCQWEEQYTNQWLYAWWLYDFFSNWCIVPLIIYEDWKIVWRSACRIFFDEQWNRYLNLERLFWHGSLIDNLNKFCVELTKDLLKLNETLTVSEKFTVTNTYKRNPWYCALTESKEFNVKRITTPLRQPKREWNQAINQWYYQDSTIFTMVETKNHKPDKYIYDCVNSKDEWALYIITKKNVSSKKAEKAN